MNRINDLLHEMFGVSSKSIPVDSEIPEGHRGCLVPASVVEIGKAIVELMDGAPETNDDLTIEWLAKQGKLLMQIQQLAVHAALATAMVHTAMEKKLKLESESEYESE